MNKRQAKKKRSKEIFLEFSKSYTENRKIERLYNEHCIAVKRKQKMCADCQHYEAKFSCLISEACCYCPRA